MHRAYRIAIVMAVLLTTSLVDTAEARRYRRSYRNQARHSTSRSLPRPVTGYGANLHRNFVLKQELRRARSGKPVRNRANIRWYRN